MYLFNTKTKEKLIASSQFLTCKLNIPQPQTVIESFVNEQWVQRTMFIYDAR